MTDRCPYTTSQVTLVRDCANRHIEVLHLEDARLILLGLHEAGIKVVFPEPRYYANFPMKADGTRWGVIYDRSTSLEVARFNGCDAEHYTREHLDRLNREAPTCPW